MTREDPELGTERYCRGCDEWWPDDNEFWYVTRREANDVAVAASRPYVRRLGGSYYVCKACHLERNRETYQRHQARYTATRRAKYAAARTAA